MMSESVVSESLLEEQMLQSAINYAKEAGKLIVGRMNNLGRIQCKQNSSDLVTEVDKLSEKFLQEKIKRDYPVHWILSEEECGETPSKEALLGKKSGVGWIIDPIDGTTNFIHGIPYFAISIGIVSDLEPVVGVVYNPVTDELFSARRNYGAFRNNLIIKVGKESKMENSLLATGFQADEWKRDSTVLRKMQQFVGKSRSIRINGAASLDLCGVATGRLTGFWHDGLHPWDTAAGALIVREAGGQVTDRLGASYQLTDTTLVASNGEIHSAFLEVIQSS